MMSACGLGLAERAGSVPWRADGGAGRRSEWCGRGARKGLHIAQGGASGPQGQEGGEDRELAEGEKGSGEVGVLDDCAEGLPWPQGREAPLR